MGSIRPSCHKIADLLFGIGHIAPGHGSIFGSCEVLVHSFNGRTTGTAEEDEVGSQGLLGGAFREGNTFRKHVRCKEERSME